MADPRTARERKRESHRCAGCGTAFEVGYYDDRRDARSELPAVVVEVGCPSCGRARVASVPAGAERTLVVERDELESAEEGGGD